MFRTQGGDFGFPFPLSGSQVDHARKYSRDLFLENKWSKQVRPLSWLLEKFKPVPDWHDPTGKELLDKVMKAGEEFMKKGLNTLDGFKVMETPKKSIIFYTDNQLPLRIAKRVQNQLKSIGLPIVSASLKPMNFGTNIHVPLKRGIETMFKQILTALQNSTSEIVFFCEHDVMYHPSHFEFTPPKKDKFYFNINVWKLNTETGKTVKVDLCEQLSGMCVYRTLAIAWCQNNLKHLTRHYEPQHNRQTWQSEFPLVDVRHGNNLTRTRWNKREFRNKRFTEGWTESDYKKVPGWDSNLLQKLLV
jgi:hypothetical protein